MADLDTQNVEYNIVLEAVQAIQNLKQLTSQAESFREKIIMVSAEAKKFAADFGVSSKSVVSIFKELDSAISESTQQSTMFGAVNKQGWDEVGRAAEGAGQRSVRSIDAIRIALGALVAMLVFNVIQAFQSLFSGALQGLRELETATYNLANAEKTLSEQGINITPQDLDAIISRLQKLDPLLSKIQASELVSSIATRVAPQVGFNKDQIQQLSEAIAVLAIRNKGLGKSFEEVEKQVTDAFLTGKVSVAINNLGVKINDQIVKDEALRLGLVKTSAEFDNLTGKMEANIKAQALLSLISENANKDLAHLPDYFKTADAAFGIFQARLQDLLTQFGVKFGPLLRQILLDLANMFSRMLDYLQKNEKQMNTFVAGLMVIAKAVALISEAFLNLTMRIGQASAKFYEFLSKLPGIGNLIKNEFGGANTADTPTGPDISSIGGEAKAKENQAKAIAEAESKIQDIMKESADKKLDIERDYQRKLEDIARDYAQRLEDIARNTAQKREDALRNYNQKVEDINRDAAQKIQDAKQEEHKKEIDREAQFQQRLKELREKFLLSLEDALHERDARQVLRLIRQYNMDKQNLEERHKLEREQAKKDLAAKLQDIEYERQKKLEAAKRDYDQRLQDIAIQEARERQEANIQNQRKLADARLWHQRQLQEQREYLQRKLRDLADALKKEFQLTQQGAQAITSMLQSTFGNIGAGMTPVVGSGAVTGGSLGNGSTWSQLANTWNSLLSTWQNSGMYGTGGMAEGGNMLATRPTKVTVGERGPEMLSVTPLDKIGNNMGKTFGDRSAMSTGGNLKIALELSPDLEARIVDSSLESVSVHLEKMSRSK